MFKTGMLAILKGLFDSLFNWANATFAKKTDVYTKLESDNKYHAKGDAIDAATLGTKSLATIEAEQAAARASLQDVIMQAVANNVHRIFDKPIVNSSTVSIDALLTGLGVDVSTLPNGFYQIVFTSSGSYTDSMIVTRGATSYTLTNNDYLLVEVLDGGVEALTHRNDTTNVALNALLTAINTKADQTALTQAVADFTASLSDYYTIEEVDEISATINNSIADLNQSIANVSSDLANNYYDKTAVDSKISSITQRIVAEKSLAIDENTADVQLSTITDLFGSNASLVDGKYMVQVIANSADDSEYVHSAHTFQIWGSPNWYKFGDRIELTRTNGVFAVTGVEHGFYTDWINRLKADTDFKLSELETELMTYINNTLNATPTAA